MPCHFSTVRPKRKRPDSLDEGDTGSSEGERRARRSTRPKTRQGMSNVDDFIASGKSRGTEPKVGPEHQADVPPVVVPVPRRTESMTEVRSTLVYSPELCQGKERVSGFLENLRTTLERRDGFGYSPNGEEKGLQLLTSHKGDVEAALDDTCKVVQVGREFDGVGKPWTYDEKCMFVRAIAEREQDFSYISRNCLNRPTSELVNMFYTYQQQQQFMHGSSAAGHIFDTGEELAQFLPRLGPERVNTAFRCLGKTAGDGFPADRRVAKAIKAVRTNSIYDQRTKRARSTRSGKPFAARPS